MSTTREINTSEILTKLRQLGKPLPTFPPEVEKVTVTVFSLQDGTTLLCCEYFHLIMKDDQLVDIKVYQNNTTTNTAMTISIDEDDEDDDDDDDMGIIIDNTKQPKSSIVVPNSSLSNPSLLKSTSSSSLSLPISSQKRYKINKKLIYINVHKIQQSNPKKSTHTLKNNELHIHNHNDIMKYMSSP